MSKLPNITPQTLIKILKSIGFELDHTTGSHYIFRHPISKRRVTIPYHSKDLPKGTIMSILKEAGITKKDLEDFLK